MKELEGLGFGRVQVNATTGIIRVLCLISTALARLVVCYDVALNLICASASLSVLDI